MKLKKETLHPTIGDKYTSYDPELYKKIDDIKNDERRLNTKLSFVEELEQEKEKEAREETLPKEEEEIKEDRPKTLGRPVLEKLNKSKNEFFFNKGLPMETFRNYAYKREGNWVCSNCDNINNPSTFECVKCKFIDMDIFAKIEEEKNNNMNKILEEKEKKMKEF